MCVVLLPMIIFIFIAQINNPVYTMCATAILLWIYYNDDDEFIAHEEFKIIRTCT